MYKIYKITNLINGKVYIGMTRRSIADRFSEHMVIKCTPLSHFQWAVKKYTPEAFSICEVSSHPDKVEAGRIEELFIVESNSRDQHHGYNEAQGGIGGNLGEAANTKRSQTILSRSLQERAAISEKLRVAGTGKTKETCDGKRRQAEKMIGNEFRRGIPHTDQTKKLMSEKGKGRPKSEETKKRMSEARYKLLSERNTNATGENNGLQQE